jgi:hypothetical protein
MSKQYILEKDKEYAATDNQSIIEAIDVLNEKGNAKIDMWTCVQSLADKTKVVAIEKEVYKEFYMMYKIIDNHILNNNNNHILCIEQDNGLLFYSSSFVQGYIAQQLFDYYDFFKVKFKYANSIVEKEEDAFFLPLQTTPIYKDLLTFATQETYELLVMLYQLSEQIKQDLYNEWEIANL